MYFGTEFKHSYYVICYIYLYNLYELKQKVTLSSSVSLDIPHSLQFSWLFRFSYVICHSSHHLAIHVSLPHTAAAHMLQHQSKSIFIKELLPLQNIPEVWSLYFMTYADTTILQH